MSGGYTASTEAMRTASRNITKLAEDLPDKNPDLTGTPIKPEGFGRVHTDHAQKYVDGMKKLSDAVAGCGKTLGTFADRIGASGSQYAGNEDAQSGAIGNAGTF